MSPCRICTSFSLLFLSNIFHVHLYSACCRFVLDDLWNTVAHVLPTIQFAYRKGLGTCDALLWFSHMPQSALGRRLGSCDFSAASDRVNYQGILYKLCSVGIGGSVLAIFTQFLPNRSQYVMVDGCRS